MRRLGLLLASPLLLLLLNAHSNDGGSTLGLRTIQPAAGASVKSATRLHAELNYAIRDFDPASTYFVVPLIAKGDGYVGAASREKVAERIKASTGVITIDTTFDSDLWGRARTEPIRLVFVMKKSNVHGTPITLAMSDPVEYLATYGSPAGMH